MNVVSRDEMLLYAMRLRQGSWIGADQLWKIISDDDRIPPQFRDAVFGHTVAPVLRLIEASPPQPGTDCVQRVELELPNLLQGLVPTLWVRFPEAFQVQARISGEPDRDTQEMQQRKRLILTPQESAQCWQPMELLRTSGDSSSCHSHLSYRLPDNISGAYQWRFRICLQCSWGHALLPRLFEATYDMQLSDLNSEMTVEISAADFSLVNLPTGGQSSRVKRVRVDLTGNAVILPEQVSVAPTETSPETPRVTTTLYAQPLIPPRTPQQRGIVQTPVTLTDSGGAGTRGVWPGLESGRLEIRPGTDTGKNFRLVLHTLRERRPLRLGRDKKDAVQEDKGNGQRVRRRQDVVTAFIADDRSELNDVTREHWPLVIAGANTEVDVTEKLLVIRNTGTQGSPVTASTLVSYPDSGRRRFLTTRGEEEAVDVKSLFGPIHLWCGGGIPEERQELGEISGYPLELTPIACWDDPSTHSWPSPEDYSLQAGTYPRSVAWAGSNGMDCLLVRHMVDPGKIKPLHVLLLRQLWLGVTGKPLDHLEDIRDHAAARLLVTNNQQGTGRVFMVQSVGDKTVLRVQHESGPVMTASPWSLVPLYPGDRLILQRRSAHATSQTPVLWTAEFSSNELVG